MLELSSDLARERSAPPRAAPAGGSAIWQRILAAIEKLQAETPEPRETVQ
jgi:hypothetical protein